MNGTNQRFSREVKQNTVTQNSACSETDAESAILAAARRQYPMPTITLGRSNWRKDGACSWYVTGALKMVDPMNIVGYWTFNAAVSRRSSGDYEADVFQVTGKLP